jgi:hypothetical protein
VILLAKSEHIGPRALAYEPAAVVGERGVRGYRLLQGLISLAFEACR